MARISELPRIPQPRPLPEGDLSVRVKELEMEVGRLTEEMSAVSIRLLRADQKIVKLKAKYKKLKEEMYEDD